MYYAHTKNYQGECHNLVDHLQGVALKAAKFASPFSAGKLAYYLGLWHDLGKFTPLFQEFLSNSEEDKDYFNYGSDHKAAGTYFALSNKVDLAYLVIHGHHGGLVKPADCINWLKTKLNNPATQYAIDTALELIPDLNPVGKLTLPSYLKENPLATEVFLRMLFSALVDADYLDTEEHFTATKSSICGTAITMGKLWELFEHSQKKIEVGLASTVVNQTRREIYKACLSAAESPQGFFRLTVPTGGGKTRSAMAFALRHALHNKLDRIIVAVPSTTVTEQTARIYQEIFEENTNNDYISPIVLEHHSNYSTPVNENLGKDFQEKNGWTHLAAENWDAPIVVTTTIQLLESLFSNRTSRCRKLHRLTNSVIILDEAQTLPINLLQPILSILQELVKNYGVTVIISTATQPAFDAIPDFRSIPFNEIVPDPGKYFDRLKRVTYDWQLQRPMSWIEVAEIVHSEQAALVVVNAKKDAIDLLKVLNDPEAFYLSRNLCSAHRQQIVNEVRHRLASGLPCKLISTQLIEAGIDLDFPTVIRAVAPLDGIIQAAGRCNREGQMLLSAKVIIFQPVRSDMPQKGSYSRATEITMSLYNSFRRTGFDLSNPKIWSRYFEELYSISNFDRELINYLRKQLNFPEVAKKFQSTEQEKLNVVVPYGSKTEQDRVNQIVDQLQAGTFQSWKLFREIQPYLVSVQVTKVITLCQQGLITPVINGIARWIGPYNSVYGIGIIAFGNEDIDV